MKTKAFVSFLVLVILSLACSIPIAVNQPVSASEPAQPPTETQLVIASPITEPTPTLPPVDITFSIDCSALDSSFQTACDEYIAATRDTIYPMLREITGAALSDCFKNINYIILPGDPAQGVGGFASGSEITYAKTYSIDLPHRYDTHELLHSISQCSKALDDHIFHGIIGNTVHARLGVFDAGYFDSEENAAELNNYLYEAIKNSSGNDLYDQCRGILGNHMTIAYFDLDKSAVTALYRATINPQPATSPNAKLTSVWNDRAAQVQVLLDTLEQQYKYPIDVPECGY